MIPEHLAYRKKDWYSLTTKSGRNLSKKTQALSKRDADKCEEQSGFHYHKPDLYMGSVIINMERKCKLKPIRLGVKRRFQVFGLANCEPLLTPDHK